MVRVNGKDMHVWDVSVRYQDGENVPVSFICTVEELQAHLNEFTDMEDVKGITYKNFRFTGTRFIHVTEPEFYRYA